MNWIIEEGWSAALDGERQKEYYRSLERFVDNAYANGVVYPPAERIFAAFERTPFARTRVVILGQDPYHGPGEAQGLSFYVPDGVKTPPSLRNIAKELAAEYPDRIFAKPDLLSWADQGVLLLNATLTVAASKPMSHARCGWEKFTDAVIRILSGRKEPCVFVLWGNFARQKGELVDATRHDVVTCAHPSPLSAHRGFFGSDCFRKVNELLLGRGQSPIVWV